ncbi:MAG: hypothetical protein DI604_20390 [Delftia acidovorans]|nr:MAG: hypothetical protein DI604_20390 [Delftia acidovorans]
MGASFYQKGQAFGLPVSQWDDRAALAFKKRIRDCFGNKAPDGDNSLTYDRHFEMVWRSIGPSLAQTRSEEHRRSQNAAELRQLLAVIDPTAPPAQVIDQIEELERMSRSKVTRAEDRNDIESQLSDLRMEAEIRLQEEQTAAAERAKAENAAAEARRVEEAAAEAEADLAAARERMQQSAEQAGRQAAENQKAAEVAKQTDLLSQSADKLRAAAEQRKRAAEAELAKLREEEEAKAKEAAEAEQQAQIAARAANPMCVAADKVKAKVIAPVGEPSAQGAKGEPYLTNEMMMIAMEAQAGETRSACRRAGLMADLLEEWRAASAKCNMAEAMQVNMAIGPLKNLQFELGCGW